MKRTTTILCSFLFMVAGVALALQSHNFSLPGNQTALASPPVYPYVGKLPLDLMLDAEKRAKTDTILIHDTVQVNNPVYVKVRTPKHITDTLFCPMPMPGPMANISVKTQCSGDREEYTPVILQSPKQSSVILTVDGQIVYSTKNDIHSTGDRQ